MRPRGRLEHRADPELTGPVSGQPVVGILTDPRRGAAGLATGKASPFPSAFGIWSRDRIFLDGEFLYAAEHQE